MAKKNLPAAVKVSTEIAVTKSTANGLPVFDISKNLPSMDQMVEAPIDLTSDYWTPEVTGETRKLFFSHYALQKFPAFIPGEEPKEVECAFFLENVNGTVRSVANASKRLVGALIGNNIEKGQALQIMWQGKKKNKKNDMHSDRWSIRPLVINLPPADVKEIKESNDQK